MADGIMEALCRYAERTPIRMHMPGHKGRRVLSSGSMEGWATLLDQVRAIDVTEVHDLDNLHYPTGCVREAERAAETLFGAARTHFLVNGASAGIHASLLGVRMVLGPGIVLLPRNVHRSVISAMIISGLEPVFVWPEYEPRLGVYMPLDIGAFRDALLRMTRSGCEVPKAVVIVNPTYSGFARDLDSIVEEAHSLGIAVLVDEAHGSHFAVGTSLPRPALRSGADLVVHGLHKTSTAYTQTAALHVGEGTDSRFPGLPSAVEEALRVVQTTSPSYVLLASIEQAIKFFSGDGKRWVDRGTEMGLQMSRRLSSIPGIRVAGYGEGAVSSPDLHHDPGKVFVILRGIGVTGPQASDFLIHKRNIVPEMTGPDSILLMVSGAHGPEDVDAVERAFLALGFLGDPKAPQASPAGEMPRPSRIMPMREAFLGRSVPVPLLSAAGRVSAETVVIYPPGSPLVVPGEGIDNRIVETIASAHKAGLNVLGRGIGGGQEEMMLHCVAFS